MVTADAIRAMGAIPTVGCRRRGGGHPAADSWLNEWVPVLRLCGPKIDLYCWADLSAWWIAAEGDGSGFWFEKMIPSPATIADVGTLCRLLGIPTEGRSVAGVVDAQRLYAHSEFFYSTAKPQTPRYLRYRGMVCEQPGERVVQLCDHAHTSRAAANVCAVKLLRSLTAAPAS